MNKLVIFLCLLSIFLFIEQVFAVNYSVNYSEEVDEFEMDYKAPNYPAFSGFINIIGLKINY